MPGQVGARGPAHDVSAVGLRLGPDGPAGPLTALALLTLHSLTLHSPGG